MVVKRCHHWSRSACLGVVEVVTDSIGVGGTFVKPGQGKVVVRFKSSDACHLELSDPQDCLFPIGMSFFMGPYFFSSVWQFV